METVADVTQDELHAMELELVFRAPRAESEIVGFSPRPSRS